MTSGAIAYAPGPYSGHSVVSMSGAAYITATNPTAMNVGTGDFTVALMLYRDAVGAFAGILGKQNGETSGELWVCCNHGSPAAIQVAINSSYLTLLDAIYATTWYHFAIVRSSGVIYVFRDGSLFGSESNANTIDNAKDLIIGSNAGANKFIGDMANLRIYNIALTGDEVAALYEYDTR